MVNFRELPDTYQNVTCILAFLFMMIRSHSHTFSFDVVCTLTDSGKNIQYMEEEIGNLILFNIFFILVYLGPYLVQILPRAMTYGR